MSSRPQGWGRRRPAGTRTDPQRTRGTKSASVPPRTRWTRTGADDDMARGSILNQRVGPPRPLQAFKPQLDGRMTGEHDLIPTVTGTVEPTTDRGEGLVETIGVTGACGLGIGGELTLTPITGVQWHHQPAHGGGNTPQHEPEHNAQRPPPGGSPHLDGENDGEVER